MKVMIPAHCAKAIAAAKAAGFGTLVVSESGIICISADDFGKIRGELEQNRGLKDAALTVRTNTVGVEEEDDEPAGFVVKNDNLFAEIANRLETPFFTVFVRRSMAHYLDAAYPDGVIVDVVEDESFYDRRNRAARGRALTL